MVHHSLYKITLSVCLSEAFLNPAFNLSFRQLGSTLHPEVGPSAKRRRPLVFFQNEPAQEVSESLVKYTNLFYVNLGARFCLSECLIHPRRVIARAKYYFPTSFRHPSSALNFQYFDLEPPQPPLILGYGLSIEYLNFVQRRDWRAESCF
jgi:hypothetical protein